MKKKSKFEIREEELRELYKEEHPDYKPEPFMKDDIEQMLKGIPLKKVKKAKRIWNKRCKWIIGRERRKEQIYRCFTGSYKTRFSFYAFVDAALIILYLYGYVPDEEIDRVEDEGDDKEVRKVLDKYKDSIPEIKEVYEKLKDGLFSGEVPMDIHTLSFGAGQVFTSAVKSIIDTIERLHKDKKYRERRYYGGVFDWDEAVLYSGLIYEYYKKGGKK